MATPSTAAIVRASIDSAAAIACTRVLKAGAAVFIAVSATIEINAPQTKQTNPWRPTFTTDGSAEARRSIHPSRVSWATTHAIETKADDS